MPDIYDGARRALVTIAPPAVDPNDAEHHDATQEAIRKAKILAARTPTPPPPQAGQASIDNI